MLGHHCFYEPSIFYGKVDFQGIYVFFQYKNKKTLCINNFKEVWTKTFMSISYRGWKAQLRRYRIAESNPRRFHFCWLLVIRLRHSFVEKSLKIGSTTKALQFQMPINSRVSFRKDHYRFIGIYFINDSRGPYNLDGLRLTGKAETNKNHYT